MGCLYCVTVKNSSHGDALLSDQKIKQCVLNLDREIPKLRISHNANFRNIKQSAVGCCIFLFFFFIISKLIMLQIHCYCSILLLPVTIKKQKLKTLLCPTSVIVTERLAIILYLYSALEICGFCCKCSLIQGQTNIPPTPYMTHIEQYVLFTLH